MRPTACRADVGNRPLATTRPLGSVISGIVAPLLISHQSFDSIRQPVDRQPQRVNPIRVRLDSGPLAGELILQRFEFILQNFDVDRVAHSKNSASNRHNSNRFSAAALRRFRAARAASFSS